MNSKILHALTVLAASIAISFSLTFFMHGPDHFWNNIIFYAMPIAVSSLMSIWYCDRKNKNILVGGGIGIAIGVILVMLMVAAMMMTLKYGP